MDRLAVSILAGFAATVVMLFAFLLAYTVALVLSVVLSSDVPGLGVAQAWLHHLTHNRLIDAGRSDVFVAAAVYVVGGLAWAVIYGLFAEPRLAGAPWVRGVKFAIVPAILSVTVFLPLVGGGMLGSALDAGPLPAIGNLVLHAIYGAVLGQLYGPFGRLDATTLRLPVENDSVGLGDPEVRAASGLLAGLVAGLILALVVTSVVGVPLDGTLLGEPVAALLLAGAMIGAAFGSVAGSVVDLGGHR